MCSSTAFFRRDGQEELILTEVMLVKPQGTGFRLVGLLGDEVTVDQAELLEIDFERNRILLGAVRE